MSKLVDDPKEIQKSLKQIRDGANLTKIRDKKRYERFYFVDLDKRALIYDGSEKPFAEPLVTIKLDEIQDIRDGRIETNKQFEDVDKSRLFSIIIGNKHKTLSLLAESEEEKKVWITGLSYLIQEEMNASQQKSHERWITDMFKLADRDENGTVELMEAMSLLKKMNADMDREYVKKMFDEVKPKPTKGKRNLNKREFIKFFKLLTRRPEIEELFNRYSQKKAYLDSINLSEFLRNDQMMNIPKSEVESLMNYFEPCIEFKDTHKLSLDGFRNFLLSNGQRLYDPKFKAIYQDMDQPLNDYFINSSHNTYLMEDQLKGPSSTEAYVKALKQGCRCVELDCWDGSDCEPVIYHGHTLTSKVLFIDVINVIKSYAFKTSQYPVILSIENHCSVAQQTVMASHLKQILGDMLYVLITGDRLPSPNELKNRILIKAKKLSTSGLDSDDSEDEAAEMVGGKKDKQKISQEFSDLVVLKSVHFEGFRHSRINGNFYEMSSLGEKKIESLLKQDPKMFVEHTNRQLVRVYPSGTRTDSSNYSPVPSWTVGAQIVALNFQTPGREMWINQGRFLDNGLSGYVLKPKILRSPGNKFNPMGPYRTHHFTQLTITVISAFQLPKPERNMKGEIIDPFVKIELVGVPDDCKTVQTCVRTDNGFNPHWNETFIFDIKIPDLAMFLFTVYDYDVHSENDFIGFFSLPYNCMQHGYRQFFLRDKHGQTRGRSLVFLHIRETFPTEAPTLESERVLIGQPMNGFHDEHLSTNQPMNGFHEEHIPTNQSLNGFHEDSSEELSPELTSNDLDITSSVYSTPVVGPSVVPSSDQYTSGIPCISDDSSKPTVVYLEKSSLDSPLDVNVHEEEPIDTICPETDNEPKYPKVEDLMSSSNDDVTTSTSTAQMEFIPTTEIEFVPTTEGKQFETFDNKSDSPMDSGSSTITDDEQIISDVSVPMQETLPVNDEPHDLISLEYSRSDELLTHDIDQSQHVFVNDSEKETSENLEPLISVVPDSTPTKEEFSDDPSQSLCTEESEQPIPGMSESIVKLNDDKNQINEIKTAEIKPFVGNSEDTPSESLENEILAESADVPDLDTEEAVCEPVVGQIVANTEKGNEPSDDELERENKLDVQPSVSKDLDSVNVERDVENIEVPQPHTAVADQETTSVCERSDELNFEQRGTDIINVDPENTEDKPLSKSSVGESQTTPLVEPDREYSKMVPFQNGSTVDDPDKEVAKLHDPETDNSKSLKLINDQERSQPNINEEISEGSADNNANDVHDRPSVKPPSKFQSFSPGTKHIEEPSFRFG